MSNSLCPSQLDGSEGILRIVTVEVWQVPVDNIWWPISLMKQYLGISTSFGVFSFCKGLGAFGSKLNYIPDNIFYGVFFHKIIILCSYDNEASICKYSIGYATSWTRRLCHELNMKLIEFMSPYASRSIKQICTMIFVWNV